MLVHQTMIDGCMSNIIYISHCMDEISIIMFVAHHFRCGCFYDTTQYSINIYIGKCIHKMCSAHTKKPFHPLKQTNRALKSAHLVAIGCIEWRNPIKQNYNCFRKFPHTPRLIPPEAYTIVIYNWFNGLSQFGALFFFIENISRAIYSSQWFWMNFHGKSTACIAYK